MGFDHTVIVAALPSLLEGAGVTLALSLIGIGLGVVVGVVLAVMMQARARALRSAGRLYISFARGTPLFVQILIVFYWLPTIGIELPRFYAAAIALSLNSGAYIAEMIRGGLTAIPTGQIEAARALAMPQRLVWRHIRLPQAFYLILPPLSLEFTALVKASSLVSVIGVVELTRTAQQVIFTTFRPVEIWVTVGLLYFVICFVLGALNWRLERATAIYRVR
jgi:polar amino acid transport system permease protein